MASLLRMPEISANTVEAVLAEWPLSENAAFAAGDAIATVETEKAVVDVPAESDGVLLRTLIEPGKSVSVGTPLAVLGAPGEAIEDLDGLVEELTGQARPEAINDGAADEPSPAGTREVSQGAVSSSDARGGASDDVLGGDGSAPVSMDLDTATADAGGFADRDGDRPDLLGGGGVPARIFASPLARRIAKENGIAIDDLHGTGPGGRIVRDDVRRAVAGRTGPAETRPQFVVGAVSAAGRADDRSPRPPSVPAPARSTAEAANGGLTAARGVPAAVTGAGAATGETPAVLGGIAAIGGAAAVRGAASATARDTVAGTGRTAGPKAAQAWPVANYEDVPHSRMRRAIAGRLAESNREAPVFSIRGSARVDALLALRRDLNEVAAVKISVNDLVVAAAARAHVAVPEMNVVWMPDAVRRFADVDIAVAVATDNGLVTPVVRGAQRLTVSALAAISADLAARARSGRLRQDELDGGTLTVTNLGAFGTEEFTAVINPPQAAILAVGAARQEPVVTGGELGIATVLRVTLSVDHRPVDGATGARWMAAFLGLLETPLRILI